MSVECSAACDCRRSSKRCSISARINTTAPYLEDGNLHNYILSEVIGVDLEYQKLLKSVQKEDKTCKFLAFHIGVAKDSVLLRYDVASLGNPRRFGAT